MLSRTATTSSRKPRSLLKDVLVALHVDCDPLEGIVTCFFQHLWHGDVFICQVASQCYHGQFEASLKDLR